MINYLTHPKFVDYDESLLPSQQTGGGGMHTKTTRVLKALRVLYPRTRIIVNSSEIDAETVLIESLRFALAMPETAEEHAYESINEVLGGLSKHRGAKIIYCSELSLARMPPDFLSQLISVSTAVTTNCKFLARVLKYYAIDTTHHLCDPIHPLFKNVIDWKSRETAILACSNISWQKNTPHLIQLFKSLNGLVKRIYIGSANLWYDTSGETEPQQLQEELYKNTDEVVKEATTQHISTLLQRIKFGAFVNIHDTFATALMEMLSCGLLVTAAKHGLCAEVPVNAQSGIESQRHVIVDLLSRSDDELEAQSRAISKWAEDNVSFEAFHRQLLNILKGVWNS